MSDSVARLGGTPKPVGRESTWGGPLASRSFSGLAKWGNFRKMRHTVRGEWHAGCRARIQREVLALGSPGKNRSALFASTAPVALLLAAVVATRKDIQIAQWLASQSFPSDVNTIFRLAETFGHFYGVLAIVISIAIVRRSWRDGVQLGLIVGAAGIAANLIKLMVGRQRPYALSQAFSDEALPGFVGWFPAWLQDSIPWGHALQSFPSGHTAAAAALAYGLSRLWPHASPWFVILAALAAGQRMVAAAHFLSDVLVGAAVGVTSAYLAAQWISSFSSRKGKRGAKREVVQEKTGR